MTRTSRLVVLGATGDVGRGVVEAALARGWAVTAVARREQALDELAAEFGPVVEVVAGSIDGDEAAVALAGALDLRPGTSVVNTISVPWSPQRLLSTSYDELVTYFAGYVGAHLSAARALLPRLADRAVYLGVGGGMADFVPRGMAPVSMVQAAQRNLYRGLQAENREAVIRELMIVSKVNGRGNRHEASAEWLTAEQVGERVVAVVGDPEAAGNSGPVVRMTPERP
ncbi:NmrA family NAD(P)-binding protein [Actinomadura madurae]|uniref:NmrA family NAD(P)-binding protein n=2 Tax=Actinomadura madurae TaxID=1993 RepID=UPI0027E27C74|nr:NAD(P)H-binding protein [Actinomadura madurae]